MEFFSIDFEDDNGISGPPQVDNPNQPKKAMLLARTFREQAESIIKIARNRWYVKADANLLDLADDFGLYNDIQAVGVVNDDQKIVGIIKRKELFDLLGRPFGRDVLSNENVVRVSKKPVSFLFHENVYAISDMLQLNKVSEEELFFVLKTEDEEFAGIFSSQDLLMYLSLQTQKDLVLARSIQSHIVPEIVTLENENLEFVGSSTMAKGVGGDFYYNTKIDDENWFMTLCDVSGKGVASSLVTCALWGVISAYEIRHGLVSLIKTLNSFFNRTFEQEKFVTGIFAQYNEKYRTLKIADQGHGLTFIYRAGRLMKMNAGQSSYPLGIMEEITPYPHKIQLNSKDIVIFMTDGLLEQSKKDGEQFGIERVAKVFEAYQNQSLKTIRVKLLEELHSFRSTNPIQDDLTFLMFRPR